MKTFQNVNPRSLAEATRALAAPNTMPAGGGSDLLGMIKERIVTPDTLVNLKSIPGMDRMEVRGEFLHIGGLVTLDEIRRFPDTRARYNVLREAAGQVATPQIRSVATIAGNVLQRPWCWYYRNHFPCYKNGGNTCFSVVGENEFHAIFGGGPSYIVHPSDTAVALVALNASFRIVGASAERTIAAAEFFKLPSVDPSKETVLAHGEVLAEIIVPAPAANTKSTYIKVLDREAWTHAVVSVAAVLEMNGPTCRSARIVLGGVAPIPWHVPEVDKMLTGQRITPELIAQAADKALEGAKPLAKNVYKIPLTRATVKQALRAASGITA